MVDFYVTLKKPRVWLAFLEILEMCVFQERFSEISTPRYFALLICEIFLCQKMIKPYR